MKIIVVNDYAEMSEVALGIIKTAVTEKPNAVLGLATGSTPIGLYERMVEDHKACGTSYKDVSTVNLDEYVGLPATHPQSYAYFMNTHLFDSIDINKENTHLPCGVAEDRKSECAAYDALLEKLVPDVQILGIGSNGHIGFNEPGTPFESKTHVVSLAASTIKDNSRLFDSEAEVPKKAFSMGISSILKSKKIVLMASGKNKAKAISALVDGEVTQEVPATALKTHPDVVVIADKDAAKLLK